MNFGRRDAYHRCAGMRWYSQDSYGFRGRLAGARSGDEGGRKMRAKPSCRPSALFDKRLSAIARRSAILLSGTAAIALSIAQPASAIVINDQVGETVGGIANYYDAGNQFPNVVSLLSADGASVCTGSLINSRTILTAAHCGAPNGISFAPISASPGVGLTSFVPHLSFDDNNDIAV